MADKRKQSYFTIAKATEKDIPGIFDCVKELALFEMAPEAVITNPVVYLEDWLKGWFEVLVAKSDDRIVGIALYHPAYSSWKGRMMYLDDLIVTGSYRGLGIGKALLDAFITEAKKSNAVICKWQVLDWNKEAVGFYEKIGAELDKGWWNVKLMTLSYSLWQSDIAV